MIANLKPYAKYKEAGLPWLKEIPTGWTTARTKTRFRLRIEKSGKDHGKELLSIYTRIGVRPRKELEQKGNKATTTNDYWIVKRGDIICNKLLAWMGAIGMSNYEGVTSPAYDILRPVQVIEPMYYHHLFRTNIYLQQFKLRSRGIMEMRLRLYFDQFGQIPLLCPPIDDQRVIVSFLDYANGRLEKAIRAKRKVIGLLNEQKQAIIHRAVTCGLDPDVPLRPSGIPWLENIPRHWEVCALKRVCRRTSLYGANIPAAKYVESGVRFLRTTDISERGELQEKAVFVSDYDASGYLLDEGDFLISRSGTVGRAFVYRADTHGACAYAGYLVRFVLRQEDLLPEFMWCFTKTPAFAAFLKSAVIASTIENVNGEKYGNMPVALPPVAEQRSILSFIGKRSTPLDTAMTRLEREIALLREYRTRLISDVVTGKVDVREAARSLPEEAEEIESAPELDTDEAEELEIEPTEGV